MPYTWEEVMFGIDTSNEAARKAKQKRDIEQEAADESTAASLWSLGLSVIGGAIFGPPGYFIGKKFGEWGADIAHPWESETMEEGKFNVAGAKEFNKTLKEAADDQTKGQILNTVLDLGKMYIQGGGLTSAPGELDLTTFGSGEDAWTLFGRGTPGTAPTTLAGEVGPEGWSELYDIGGTSPSADYVSALWSPERSIPGNLLHILTSGGELYGQDKAVSDFGRLGLDYYESQKEKRAG